MRTFFSCVGVRSKESGSILVIENSGKRYRICKPEDYDVAIEERHNRLKEAEERRYAVNQESFCPIYKWRYREVSDGSEERLRLREEQRQNENLLVQHEAPQIPPDERTCFMCKRNLAWYSRPDENIAHCGPYKNMGVPQKTPPDTAKMCKGFVPK